MWVSVGMTVYLVSVFFAGIRLVPSGNQRGILSITSGKWHRADVISAVACCLFAAFLLAVSTLFPMDSDESSNIEYQFFSSWFLARESGAFPPLFRFLINMTYLITDRIFMIRLPSVIFSSLSLFLFVRIASVHVGYGAAWLLAFIAFLSEPVRSVIFSQRPYAMWIFLILGTHFYFWRAVCGEVAAWRKYFIFAFFAAMTHYLTVFFLVAHLLYTGINRRDRPYGLFVSQGFVFMALAPFLIPVVSNFSGVRDGLDIFKGASFLVSDAWVLLKILWPLLLPAAVLIIKKRGTGESKLLAWSTIIGTAGIIAASLTSYSRVYYYSPVIILLVLWFASMIDLPWSSWSAIYKVAASVVAVVMCMLPLIQIPSQLHYKDGAIGRRHDPVLFIREYLKKSSGKAGNIIIYPKHLAGPAVYEIRGRRLVAGEIQHREECFEEAHADGITVHWFIRTSGTEGCLEKALNRWEKFDCIIFKPEEQDPQAKRNTDFPIIKSWLGKRCRLTISNDFGTVWSCLRTQDGA